ncbi:hypothetical protein JKP88DRAFT_316124 [Tribonema minus]|uniref:C2 domain-containing protein n=1 Tax=Tribonema minus TaxID=303371 RepID=A0A836CHA3_9STRA|nr:hypothetical protein JKP88DRAFT_316124 [Tribonema minus]
MTEDDSEGKLDATNIVADRMRRLAEKKEELKAKRAARDTAAGQVGPGGFAGATLTAKRERLRQQREERQSDPDLARSWLLRRGVTGGGAGADSDNAPWDKALADAASDDDDAAAAGRARHDDAAARLAAFDAEDTALLLGRCAAATVLLPPRRAFPLGDVGVRCCGGGRCAAVAAPGVDPGEAARAVLVPGSGASEEGLRELRGWWLQWLSSGAAEGAQSSRAPSPDLWRRSREAERQRRTEDGLAVPQCSASVARLAESGRLYERLMREQLLAQDDMQRRAAQRAAAQRCGDETEADDPGAAGAANFTFSDGGDAEQDTAWAPAWELPEEVALLPPMRCERGAGGKDIPPPGRLAIHVVPPVHGIGTEARLAGGSRGDRGVELRVAIPRVALHDHPLFCHEDSAAASLARAAAAQAARMSSAERGGTRLYARARQLYGRYCACVASGSAAFLLARLRAAVAAALALLSEGGAGDADALLPPPPRSVVIQKLCALQHEALATLDALAAAHAERRALTQGLYGAWRDIEECRREEGFVSTPARLVVRAVAASAAADAPANKLSSEGLSYKEQLDAVEDLEEWLAASAEDDARNHADGYAATAQNGGSHGRVQGAGGGVTGGDVALRLSADTAVTPDDEVPAAERARRAHARRASLYCALYVNGARVTATPHRPLDWPHFVTPLDFAACLRVRIYRHYALWPDEELASFAGARVAPAEGGPGGGTRVAGAVLVGMEWAVRDGSGGLDLAAAVSLPAAAAPGSVEPPLMQQLLDLVVALWSEDGRKRLRSRPLVGPRSAAGGRRKGKGLAAAGSALAHAAAGDADPNDPRIGSAGHADDGGEGREVVPYAEGYAMQLAYWGAEEAPVQTDIAARRASLSGTAGGAAVAALVAAQRRRAAAAAQRQRRHPYTARAHWRESTRHALLRLRRRRPHAFGARAIPLTEKECRADEVLDSILTAAEAEAAVAAGTETLNEEEAAAAAAAGYGLDALLEDPKGERLAVDPKRLADFLRLVQGTHTAAGRHARGVGGGGLWSVPVSSVVREPPQARLRWLELGHVMMAVVPPPRRALRPALRERAPVVAKVESCRLLVQIIGARNVPARLATSSYLARFGVGRAGASPEAAPPRAKLPDQNLGMGGIEEGDGYQSGPPPAQAGGVTSFVEVRFQGGVRRTQAYEGRAPLWRETVDLPFTPPGGEFSPEALAQVKDAVHVSLFDSVEFDDSARGGFVEGEETVRTEKHFLGSVAIPFQTVYSVGRLEGYLRLKVPPVNLGYEGRAAPSAVATAGNAAMPATIGDASERKTGDEGASAAAAAAAAAAALDPASPAALARRSERSTYVRVLVMLEPLLVRRDDGAAQQAVGEGVGREGMLAAYAQRWQQRLAQAQEKEGMQVRVLKVFVPLAGGREALVTRFLVPQEPPEGLDTPQKLAHFVRLVPFLEDWQAVPVRAAAEAANDMWCTSQQFLDILAGDWEEHAILLHNYLLWLYQMRAAREARRAMGRSGGAPGDVIRGAVRTDVMLVLGRGVPEGSTAYVLVKEVDRFGDTLTAVLWNAATGVGYEARDSQCPLIEVGCVISAANVWANVQRSAKPWEMSWDTRQTSAWRPYFAPGVNPALDPPPQPLQPPLVYRATDVAFVYKVEDLLRETIKRDVRRWRAKKGPTSFNADVSNRLAEVLPLLEQQERGETPLGDVTTSSLESIMRQRNIVGFPLHAAFTSVTDVSALIRATGVHDAKHPEVQFALAVQCFPYCNNVLSVWVYIASITPRV